jgi:hypothetical protein
LNRHGFAALAFDRLHHGGSRFAVLCIRDGDGRSIRGQPFRDPRANTPRTAGNQRNLIG